MKKVWNQFSYGIILVCLTFIIAIVLAGKSESTIKEEYVTIVIEDGDTLWDLANQYNHDYSNKQFINWVMKTNQIDDRISIGQSIVIPIKKDNLMLASGDKE